MRSKWIQLKTVVPQDPQEDLLDQEVLGQCRTAGQTQEEKNAPCKREAGGACSLLVVRSCARRPLLTKGRKEEAGLLIKEETKFFMKKSPK